MGYAADVSEEEILKTLWYAMDVRDVRDVREIVLSIAASGFFSIDPIIVDKSSGKNIVIEGNRRLAAVRIIRNPEKYRSIIEEDIPKVDPEKVRSTDP
jgi:ParB-like chromosome segregation protein Spo0J